MNSFETRRARFVEKMKSGAALIPSAHEQLRNNDTYYRFRPDSDFFYLTGFPEPDAMLLLAPHHAKHQVVLFVRPNDPEKETWTGRRVGVEGAIERFGADAAYPIEELETRLAEYLVGPSKLFYRLGPRPELDRKVISVVHSLRQAKRRVLPSPTSIIDPSIILHEQRLRKDPEELDCIRQAAKISGEAHRLVMSLACPGRKEQELEALLDFHFRRQGGGAPSYPTIVASGRNATTLHYIDNSDVLENGQLLLVDAACEYQYYAADITRTYPVNGHFTSTQREVYSVVLAAQKAAIECVKPGSTIDAVHDAARNVLAEGLISLGVLKESVATLLETDALRPYFMHRTSHWLGLDVHDAGDYVVDGRSRMLEEGMVLTVEPGLYFGPNLPDVPQRLRGIGVRVEDDVLVTSDAHEVLTSDTPKSIEELEAVVGTASSLRHPENLWFSEMAT